MVATVHYPSLDNDRFYSVSCTFILVRNLVLGKRVTDFRPGPNLVNAGSQIRAASRDTLCSVAMATRNTVRKRRSGKEGVSWNLVDCSKFRTFSRDQKGVQGVAGSLCQKKEALRRSHSLSLVDFYIKNQSLWVSNRRQCIRDSGW